MKTLLFKRVLTGLLPMTLVVCPVHKLGMIPSYASELYDDSTIVVSDGCNDIVALDCKINVAISSDFTITIPKKIILSGTDGTSTYDVTAKGNISAEERINVVPDNNFALKSAGKADVATTVFQNKTSFGYVAVGKTDAFGTVIGTTVQGTVTAEELSAGNWVGTFNFNISMTQGLKAGAYDADGVMVASWEELTGTYGLDVEREYYGDPKAENAIQSTPTSGYYVLTNNEALKDVTSIVIGNDVTFIGMCAFQDCKNLTSVLIPDSVNSIDRGAFYRCTSLTSITIPDSVTSVGKEAFMHCTSLGSITIPDSVNSISEGAFFDCSSLTSIAIPDGVTSIGMCAFEQCSNLSSVTIPDSVTSIGKSAFGSCTSLTSVTIPDSVTSIEFSAFYGCSSLTSVTIPNSVTSIDDLAFKNVPHIYYNGTATGSPWGAMSIN